MFTYKQWVIVSWHNAEPTCYLCTSESPITEADVRTYFQATYLKGQELHPEDRIHFIDRPETISL